MNSVEFENDNVGRLLLRLSIPSVIAQLVNLLYNIVDRIYLGRIAGEGTLVLTGLGRTLPLINVVTACSQWIGLGSAPLIAIALGKKDKKEAEEIAGNCFTMLIIMSAIVTSLLVLCTRIALVGLGASGQSLEYAMKYMRVYMVGTVFVILATGLNPLLLTQGFNKISMKYSVFCMFLNIILDPIFIFGFKLGLEGAAIATVLSQLINSFFILGYLLKEKRNFELKISRLNINIVNKVLSLGLANFFMGITESFVQTSFIKQITKYGNDFYMAAMSILFSINSCIMHPLQGMGQGAQPILSYNFGAGNQERLRKTIKTFVCAELAISIIMVGIVEIIPGVLLGIFTSDKEVISVGVKALRIYTLGRATTGIHLGLQQMFSSIGYAKTAIFNAGMRKLVYLIPLVFFLPTVAGLGINGVFLAESVADTLAAITISFVFLFIRKDIIKRTDENYSIAVNNACINKDKSN